jgi:hypothetical protein
MPDRLTLNLRFRLVNNCLADAVCSFSLLDGLLPGDGRTLVGLPQPCSQVGSRLLD